MRTSLKQSFPGRRRTRTVSAALVGFLLLGAASACSTRAYNESETRAALPAEASPAHEDGDEQTVTDANATSFIARASGAFSTAGGNMKDAELCRSVLPKLRFSGKMDSPSAESLAYFAYLAALSNKAPAVVEQWKVPLGLQSATPLYDATTDTRAYIFDRGGELIVTFAGTASASNVLTDIDLVFDSAFFGTGVHKGFLRSYGGQGARFNGIRNELIAALKARGYPGRKVYIAGHSLGGGLASLLALDLVAKEQLGEGGHGGQSCDVLKEGSQGVAGVVTFGSTRVGNEAFATCYNRILKKRTFRVVNDLDLFPLLATRAFYQHAGRRVRLDGDGKIFFSPEESEEPSGGSQAFMAQILKGGILRNVVDHLSYPHKLAGTLDKACPRLNPVASKFGVK